MKKLEYPPAPMLLCMVLGDRLESSFRQSLVLSGGSFSIFVTHPIAATLLALAVVLTIASLVARRRRASALRRWRNDWCGNRNAGDNND